ncbi:hypothetical protein MP638_007461 [Amoeboaphelidium occidentale]|nr:hypothetical protein MP638_007461 [Amoeboaphelidium occidentale]
MTQVIKVLVANKKNIPYAFLATVHYVKSRIALNIEYQADTPLKVNDKPYSIVGACRLVARSVGGTDLVGSTPEASTAIDYWIDYAHLNLEGTDYKLLTKSFAEMNHHLKMRTFFVGYSLSLADLVLWGYLRGSMVFQKLIKTPPFDYVNLVRWYNFIGSFDGVEESVVEVLASQRAAAKERKDEASFEIDLPGVEEGKVCTRFPPEPSGYLHIGHAKAALLNQYFAQRYKGRLIIRFDDTNPSKEKVEFEESILEDLKALEVKGDVITWTSDYFDKMYELAKQMIKEGKAYVDDTPVDVMRQQRMDGIASANRDASPEENMKKFDDMFKATEYGLKCCLRAKISVDAKNKALRDPVIYRCNLTPHNRTGDKWKIYPTYDFACPIVDSLEGVTHALRTTEYHDRNDQYYWFIDALKLRKVHIWDFSRMNFVYTLLSKRKLQWFVDNEKVESWADPRFPTVRGILRRGLTIEALKKYILMQGPSKNTLLLTWDKLWAVNKQIIDNYVPRFVALDKEGLAEVELEGDEFKSHTEWEKELPKHKKNPDVGTKQTWYSKKIYLDFADAKDLQVGEEVTLMDWGNVILTSTSPLKAKLNLDGDFKKTKKKLTWLAKKNDKLTPVLLKDFDFLITKKKLEEGDSFEDCLNPMTELDTAAVGDANLKSLKKGDIIQLERRGYFICDQAFDEKSGNVTLIAIPDGRTATCELKYKPEESKK